MIEYFGKRGSNVYSTSMDMSKAFDNIRWSKLFELLVDRKIDPIFLRLTSHTYENQTMQVKRDGILSEFFAITLMIF